MKPALFNFLFSMSVAVVLFGLLGWQLFTRSGRPTADEYESYLDAKARSGLLPLESSTMTVADLISLLQRHDHRAMVVLWETAPREGHVSKLGVGEVQPLQLGTRECNGLLVVEPWTEGDNELQGPVPGVVLGSL